jgi:hypothetical protein
MTMNVGDVVEIRALPATAATLAPAQLRVYEACVGLKLTVSAIHDDGTCGFTLGQEWDHFPDVTPFELCFEPACLSLVCAFTAEEWALLSAWAAHDATITGTVGTVDGRAVVVLEGGLVADLVSAEPTHAHHGSTLQVHIVMLNKKRRALAVAAVHDP